MNYWLFCSWNSPPLVFESWCAPQGPFLDVFPPTHFLLTMPFFHSSDHLLCAEKSLIYIFRLSCFCKIQFQPIYQSSYYLLWVSQRDLELVVSITHLLCPIKLLPLSCSVSWGSDEKKSESFQTKVCFSLFKWLWSTLGQLSSPWLKYPYLISMYTLRASSVVNMNHSSGPGSPFWPRMNSLPLRSPCSIFRAPSSTEWTLWESFWCVSLKTAKTLGVGACVYPLCFCFSHGAWHIVDAQ